MIIDLDELNRILNDMKNAKVRLEMYKQDGTIYYLDRAINNLSGVIDVLTEVIGAGELYIKDAEEDLHDSQC